MIYRLVLNDPEKEHLFKSKQISLLKEKQKENNVFPDFTLASMHNYLSSCWRLGRYDALEKGITEIQAFIDKNPMLERNMLFVYYLEILLLFGKNISLLSEDFEKRVLTHINKYKLGTDYLANLIYLRLAIIHLALNNHKRVSYYLRRIDENTALLSDSFKSVIFVVELMSHYQSDDGFLVQYRINAETRKRKKKNIPASSDILSENHSLFQSPHQNKYPQESTLLAEELLEK